LSPVFLQEFCQARFGIADPYYYTINIAMLLRVGYTKAISQLFTT